METLKQPEFRTIYDIELKYNCYISDILKSDEYKNIFIEIFNTGLYCDTDLFLIEDMIKAKLAIFTLEQFGIILQIIGLYHKLIKNDIEISKKYFLKAIDKGNINAYVSLSSISKNNEDIIK